VSERAVRDNDMYPFGGVKQNGIGREGVEYAMEKLSQVKSIGIRPGVC
jgi:acyl-CoA reductase-like NAD-dependent aldehyde dehydrogenase